MYRAKRRPLVEEQAGGARDTDVPPGDLRPKLERVTDRLHELLASLEVDEITLH